MVGAAILKIRTAARTTLGFVLQAIPIRVAHKVTFALINSSPKSAKRRVSELLLEILRHRGIPSELEDFALPGSRHLRFVNTDSVIAQRLFWFGEDGWEPSLLPWWRAACRRATGICEIGANIGYFTVQGGGEAPDTRYVAVEPHPLTAETLRRNVALNGLANVEVWEAAAVDDAADSSVVLNVPSADHYAVPAGALIREGSERQIPTGGVAYEVRAIEAIKMVTGTDLWKLDIEGLEYRILSSLEEKIRVSEPTIFIEVLDGTPQLRKLLLRLCAEVGYQCFAPEKSRLIRVNANDLLSLENIGSLGTRDLIFTRWDDFAVD